MSEQTPEPVEATPAHAATETGGAAEATVIEAAPASADETSTVLVALPEQQPSATPAAEPVPAQPASAGFAPPATAPSAPSPSAPSPSVPSAGLVPPAPQPMPQQAPPGSFPLMPPQYYALPQQPPKPKRPFPWRWAGAAVVAVAVGAGCAFAVAAPPRTDLPGLKTASDGRYDFGPLTLPTLAPGQADPVSSANAGGQHLSDIRKLLLTAPQGAKADSSLPGDGGWVSKSDTLAVLDSSSTAAESFSNDGWRHTAGVAWKTPDGADTKIYLLQFIDASAASDATDVFTGYPAGGGTVHTYSGPGQAVVTYSELDKNNTKNWYGWATVGDTDVLVVFAAPPSVGITPFQQEMDLQLELLQ